MNNKLILQHNCKTVRSSSLLLTSWFTKNDKGLCFIIIIWTFSSCYCWTLNAPPVTCSPILDMHLHRNSKSTSLFRKESSVSAGSMWFFWALICWFWLTSFFSLFGHLVGIMCPGVFLGVGVNFRSVRYKLYVISARSQKFSHRIKNCLYWDMSQIHSWGMLEIQNYTMRTLN